MADETTHRRSGEVCTTSGGQPIVYRGHAAEGANLVAPIGDEFCMWTRCGSSDVPANRAYRGTAQEVSCRDCISILAADKTFEGGE